MKYLNICFVTLLLCATMNTWAQNKNIEKQLIGTWLFDDQISFDHLSQNTIDFFESISTDQVKEIKDLYIGRIIDFGEGGIYYQELSDKRSLKGKWRYDSNLKELIISHSLGGEIRYRIKKVSETKLFIKPIVEGASSMHITDLYFNKI